MEQGGLVLAQDFLQGVRDISTDGVNFIHMASRLMSPVRMDWKVSCCSSRSPSGSHLFFGRRCQLAIGRERGDLLFHRRPVTVVSLLMPFFHPRVDSLDDGLQLGVERASTACSTGFDFFIDSVV